MRHCRPDMVRTVKQYEFIYDVLFDALLTHHSVVSYDVNVSYRLLNRLNPHTANSYFHEQFKVFSSSFHRSHTSSAHASLNYIHFYRTLQSD